jgi:hypothetical protein
MVFANAFIPSVRHSPRRALLCSNSLGLLTAAILLAIAFQTHAQTTGSSGSPTPDAAVDSEDFYTIYEYETPRRGWFEPNLLMTYIPESRNGFWDFNTSRPREGLTAYTTEIEYGVTDHFSLSTYVDLMAAHGSEDYLSYPDGPRATGLEFTQARVEARYRFAEPRAHFFDVAGYIEYYFPRKSFSTSQELETRLILERNFRDFRLDMNPTLAFSTTGGEASAIPALDFNAGIYYERVPHFEPGVEYYSAYSSLNKVPPTKLQQDLIFPTIAFPVKNLEWQIGVGFGLTPHSDQLTLKTIVSYQFDGKRLSRLFGRDPSN